MKRGLALLLASLSAEAAQPVILVEAQVPQFRTAAAAAKAHLPNAVEVDPGDGALDAKLSNASVVVAVGQRALNVAKQKAPSTPVVFCMVLGVKRSLLTPTVTGVPLESDPGVMLGQIRSVYPNAKRIGLVYSPENSELLIADANKAAQKLSLALVAKPVAGPAEVRDAVQSIAGGIDALWLPPDPKLFSRELFSFLLGFAAERRVPLFGFLDSFTQAGALASVSPDYADIGQRAGRLAAEIVGKPEAQRVPVPAPVFAPGTLTINMKTAHALGIAVSPKALADAKQVFR